MNMYQYFQQGDTLYGYCNGFFGRDSYSTKICTLVRPKYAVFEYEDGTADILNYDGRLTEEMVKKWKSQEVDL